MNVKKNLFLQMGGIFGKLLNGKRKRLYICGEKNNGFIGFCFVFALIFFIYFITHSITPQIPRPNPLLIQVAFALQNLIKMQQKTQNKNNINFALIMIKKIY